MKITIENTSKVVGVKADATSSATPARVWEGTTDSGIPVICFVTRIAVANDQDSSQFEAELEACRDPSPEVKAWPLRMVL